VVEVESREQFEKGGERESQEVADGMKKEKRDPLHGTSDSS